ncbi:YfiT family bacillithiol transferase [Paenibacillus turpanensis]|uniref:YfiT family bacillithiol transferase n=1 Tax=Paenibacillus turpanensis TaxID=2689078 RepID=UPI00140AEEBA|nr:putative metal-dependent hydrolase [Paenibacillus turpanensis]
MENGYFEHAEVEIEERYRYPIGRFQTVGEISAALLEQWIDEIEQLPAKLAAAVEGLSAAQLETPYRPGGWTASQVVHHIADSHMNSIIRFKLALTEQTPTIKPYEEASWALLSDSIGAASVDISIKLISALHARWGILLRSMSEKQWERAFHHPDSGLIPLRMNAGIYAWHGKHHTAHITELRRRMGW